MAAAAPVAAAAGGFGRSRRGAPSLKRLHFLGTSVSSSGGRRRSRICQIASVGLPGRIRSHLGKCGSVAYGKRMGGGGGGSTCLIQSGIS